MFDELIKKYKLANESRDSLEETYFEICGFPHYENVVSNVLAFFFDHENNHNLNGLVARSLLEAAHMSELTTDLQFLVEREVQTDSRGFIDILLKNDTCTIVIENKIWAKLTNNLEDYIESAKKHVETADAEVVGIVLSMRSIETKHPDFINVTYSEFLSKIRSNIGDYVTHNATQNFNLLIHLINTLENLESGVQMNNEFVQFVRENPRKVEDFAAELKKYHANLREIVKRVNAIVTDKVQDIDLKQWHVRTLPKLHDICVSDFKTKNNKDIAIDSIVDFSKWKFGLFPRNSSCTLNEIVEFCQSNGIKGSVKEKRYVLEDTLPLETDVMDVAEKIESLIRKIQPKHV